MSTKEYIRHLHTVYTNSMKDGAPTIEAPEGALKVPLHLHQKTVMSRMEELESDLTKGMKVGNDRLFSNYGIIGDSVGAGKSLMVLGHIARMNEIAPLERHSSIHSSSTPTMFSISTKYYTDISEAGCLIIVPHTLFRQWGSYIEDQTNLKHFSVARHSQLHTPTFIEKVISANVVLVSNTLCKPFLLACAESQIKWKRVFIDEADTIHLAGLSTPPFARFFWLITASWANLIYPNNSLYIDRHYLDTHIFNAETRYPHLQAHFTSRLAYQNSYYIVEFMRVKSVAFFKELVSLSHPGRSQVVLTCSDELIKKSISLPPLIRQVIWCKSSITHQIVNNSVSGPIQQMLHAGDITGALDSLGVKGKDTKSLIEAVTANLQKDLERLEKTYAFKESMEYSTPQLKEAALQALKEKIQRAKESINGIKERIKNSMDEICPICYDEPTDHLMTPCCSRVFCVKCLLLSIATRPECPLCRAAIHPSKCTKLLLKDSNEILDEGVVKTEGVLLKKHEALLRLIRENPTGKFLVFSRYDNPFDEITKSVADLGVQVRNLKGSKDTIASTIRSFDSGAVRCLLLNSQYAGSGLNITAATHVVLLHAMTHEEEKQILGRSYRLGREGPLTFIKLLNKGEETYSSDDSVQELE